MYDANVLFPAFLRDLLVRLSRAGVVAARWSERIHDEWMRNLLAKHRDIPAASIQRVRSLMDAAVPGAVVEGYEHRIDALRLPDPDDRHVLAAAIETGADLIVTINLRDFPADALSSYGIEARHPDAFVLDLLLRAQTAVLATFRGHRAALRKPPLTSEEYLHKLAEAGLPGTAEALRRMRAEL